MCFAKVTKLLKLQPNKIKRSKCSCDRCCMDNKLNKMHGSYIRTVEA